jgi:PhnB protein
MAQLIPYLTFDGNCREAMTFYKDCIGGELELQTVGGSPMAASMPPEMKTGHAFSLTAKGIVIRPDAMGHDAGHGNMVTLCVVGDSESDRECFACRGKGQPALKKESSTVGLTDKPGIA